MNDIENIILDLAAKSAVSIPRAECDYIGEDGLLYCGKCHTKKQTVVTLNDIPITVNAFCECGQIAYEAEEARQEAKRKHSIIDRFKDRCFQDSEYKYRTFKAADNSRQIETAKTYAENWLKNKAENIGLLFYGECSSGKSFAAACIANYVIDNYCAPCKMVNLAYLINGIQSSFERNAYIDEFVRSPSLLIIDDYGAQRDTSYANEVVFNIIDSRINTGKPLIVTTNLTLEEMKAEKDLSIKRSNERIISACVPVLFSGENKRKAIGHSKIEQFRKQINRADN